MPYGKRWRKHRQWIQSAYVDKTSLLSYRPIQRRESYALVAALLESPEQFLAHSRRFAAAIVMETVFGQPITSGANEEHLQAALRATMATNDAATLTASLVNFFPFMRHIPTWMPGAGFKRNALLVRTYVSAIMDKPYDVVKAAITSGTAKPSFMTSCMDKPIEGDPKEHEEDIKGAAGVLYAAGIDTTMIALSTLILAMTLYPECLKKAQEEIGRVVGSDRLPEFEDRESLPYLECIIKEVYRWNPPVPLGITHSLSENDDYHGYHMPKGGMVVSNIWGMANKSDVYDEPDAFRPERFADMDPDIADLKDPRKYVFGFGRRICPGRYFADTSIWLAAASMIATLDIHKARDSQGQEIIPPAAFKPGFIRFVI